jgi:hypothetical protein
MQRKGLFVISLALVFVALVMGTLFVLAVRTPAELAKNVANSAASFVKENLNFTPQVTINNVVVIEQTAPILELATISRDLSVEYNYTTRWLFSTKTLMLRGTYTAKAGFDLTKPFRINVDQKTLKLTAQMPEPKLLSLQLNSYQILRDEDGFWNKVTREDREAGVNGLQAAAREQALSAGLLDAAKTSLQTQLQTFANQGSHDIEFQYRSK